MLRDDALGDLSNAADGDVSEVEAGLLMLLEAGVEAAAALMAGVGLATAKPRASPGSVLAAFAPMGGWTEPLRPPPP